MNKEQLEDYLTNYIKPAIEEYAKEKNISIEELLEQSKENLKHNNKIKPLINNEWIQWLSYEKDEKGNAKLKENTPDHIKKQYEEYKKNIRKRREILDE